MIVLKSSIAIVLVIATLFFIGVEIADMYDSFIIFQLPPECVVTKPLECW